MLFRLVGVICTLSHALAGTLPDAGTRPPDSPPQHQAPPPLRQVLPLNETTPDWQRIASVATTGPDPPRQLRRLQPGADSPLHVTPNQPIKPLGGRRLTRKSNPRFQKDFLSGLQQAIQSMSSFGFAPPQPPRQARHGGAHETKAGGLALNFNTPLLKPMDPSKMFSMKMKSFGPTVSDLRDFGKELEDQWAGREATFKKVAKPTLSLKGEFDSSFERSFDLNFTDPLFDLYLDDLGEKDIQLVDVGNFSKSKRLRKFDSVIQDSDVYVN